MSKTRSFIINGENVINVPNGLSLYRLWMFPAIVLLCLTGAEQLFAVFICINLITDILDGLIARTFKLQTRFGARLDSLADVTTYISAILGLFCFFCFFPDAIISFVCNLL